MIKALLAAAFALTLNNASAQSAAQWSQLLSYVSQQTKLIIDLRSRVDRLEASDRQLRSTLNVTISALDQERCRVSRLTTSLVDFVGKGIAPDLVDGVSCIDLKSPAPEFPTELLIVPQQ